MKPIQFADGITLLNLNPFNYALKNDYINNLMNTGMCILPIVADTVVGDISIKKCFTSKKQFLNNDYEKEDPRLSDKFSEGLAIRLTWDEYDANMATQLAYRVMSQLELKMNIAINNTANHITFYLDTDDQSIYEITPDNSKRIIKKY
ncbi:MAG TPA: hypothetical protein PL124_03940 [Candidatus Cloacimonadota bacterium]|nr:hypothetical protein [Candidatus Cloacimonadota bacterium]HPS38542.1 hypothetical protein [Candidatus Cloacimonadota bacterium]